MFEYKSSEVNLHLKSLVVKMIPTTFQIHVWQEKEEGSQRMRHYIFFHVLFSSLYDTVVQWRGAVCHSFICVRFRLGLAIVMIQ